MATSPPGIRVSFGAPPLEAAPVSPRRDNSPQRRLPALTNVRWRSPTPQREHSPTPRGEARPAAPATPEAEADAQLLSVKALKKKRNRMAMKKQGPQVVYPPMAQPPVRPWVPVSPGPAQGKVKPSWKGKGKGKPWSKNRKGKGKKR